MNQSVRKAFTLLFRLSLGVWNSPVTYKNKENKEGNIIDNIIGPVHMIMIINMLINIFISYLLRFLDRIDRMKNSYENFSIQSQSRIDFLTCGKSRFIQSEISCQNESVSSQTHSRCFWHVFNLHSQKFVDGFHKFTQVFWKICHKPQTKFEQVYRFRQTH